MRSERDESIFRLKAGRDARRRTGHIEGDGTGVVADPLKALGLVYPLLF